MSSAFLKQVQHPFKSKLFLLMKLPSAFFSGVSIKYVDAQKAIVVVPYKWFTKNPFRSTYFACLAMAGELSTGLLAMLNVYERKPAVSMLVIQLEARYFKKATGITTFTCDQGEAFTKVINEAVNTRESKQFISVANGVNEAGELVATFTITWSFKVKS